MRLDKLLAHSGFGSRKDVKQLLKKKVVVVDNKVITKGDVQVNPEKQEFLVNGNEINYMPYIYVMLHKPPGHVSATVDNRFPTVIDLIPKKMKHKELSPVGRLDKDTEGLILLTNDGQLNHRLTSPNHDVFKTYYAKIDGHVREEHIQLFKEGITLDDGYKTKPGYLEIIQSGKDSEITLSISEGKFHQVKRMFEAIGTKVVYLKRMSIGELRLDPSLPIGHARLLTEDEVQYVLNLAAKKI